MRINRILFTGVLDHVEHIEVETRPLSPALICETALRRATYTKRSSLLL